MAVTLICKLDQLIDSLFSPLQHWWQTNELPVTFALFEGLEHTQEGLQVYVALAPDGVTWFPSRSHGHSYQCRGTWLGSCSPTKHLGLVPVQSP